MRRPANQPAQPIPESLLPFAQSYGTLEIDKERDLFIIVIRENGKKKAYAYTTQQINNIDTRLKGAIDNARLAPNVWNDTARYDNVALQVQCWYNAVMLDVTPIYPCRYFLLRVDALNTDTRDNKLCSLEAMVYEDHVFTPSEIYEANTTTGQFNADGLRRECITAYWKDLEALWPGIQQQILACEAMGMNQMETALQVFGEQVPEYNNNTPHLPDNLIG